MKMVNEPIEGFIVESEEDLLNFKHFLKTSEYHTNDTITYPALYIEHVGNMLIKRSLEDIEKLKQCGYTFHKP